MAIPDYGRETRTLWEAGGPDLDPYFRRIEGPQAVAHAVARRLVTPTGALSWDLEAGFDLRGLLGADYDDGFAAAVAAAVETEALKDERVAGADATVLFDAPTQSGRISVRLTLADGPTFDLVLAVSSVSVTLLSVR